MASRLHISPLSEWLPGRPLPLVISGPCGAETEEQVMETARALAATGKVSIFRAGIWKPRTRPNSFEGVGSVGLQWLRRVRKETGLLTTVEVANAGHAEEALKAGVDILWIGARTTVNPFTVQEIADVLQGTNVPVMVKNPVNPDLQLWIGALERINNAGITKLIAVHRGFSSFEKTRYRNAPQWEIPIALKTEFPELPVICDPSHICGRTDLIGETAQKALDLDMAGLMIESHCDPKAALSDAKQQLTLHELEALLSALVVRKVSSQNQDFANQLEALRASIDDIDEEILMHLTKRMDLIGKIGEYKRNNGVTILQLERWLEILRTRTASGVLKGLDEEFIRKVCQLLHEESIRLQTEVMNSRPVK